jgi:hypothetical protein
VVRQALRARLLPGFLLLASLIGCRERTAQQVVEERLEKRVPPSSLISEVEGYLQDSHADIVEKSNERVLDRFHRVKSTGVCVEDIQVEFKFDRDQRLIAHHSEEMRVCL